MQRLPASLPHLAGGTTHTLQCMHAPVASTTLPVRLKQPSTPSTGISAPHLLHHLPTLQVRAALLQAAQLAPQLGYGSRQDVMDNARAAKYPDWQACVFGEAAELPPATEVPAQMIRPECHP